MRPLGRQCLRTAAIACASVLLVALAAGLVRLLPWLLATQVPWAISTPFAKALAAVAVETALLLGLPTGFAVGAAIFVERGEARALLTLGASPIRLVAGSLPHALAAAVAAYLLLAACDVDAHAPGRIAAQLIEQGKSSCRDAASPRSALVPMVGVTWLCFPGQPPRVAGTLPKLGDRAWFTAAELRPSEDLRTFVLEDLRLVTRAEGTTPRINLHVEHAVVSGLTPWGRSAKLSTLARAGLVSAVGVTLSLLVAWLVIVSSVSSRVVSAALGAASALAAMRALHQVDHGPSGLIAYLWVPVAGIGAALAGWLLWAAVARILLKRRPRPAESGGQFVAGSGGR